MIAVLKQGTTPAQTTHLIEWLKGMSLDVHISEGAHVTILGLIGDTSRVDMDLLKSLEIPSAGYNMLPNSISLVELIFTSKKSRAPKAEGIPYDKGTR